MRYDLDLVSTKRGYAAESLDQESAEQMQIAEQGMKVYQSALRDLAK